MAHFKPQARRNAPIAASRPVLVDERTQTPDGDWLAYDWVMDQAGGITAATDATARPSSADVLRELEALRAREGISPTKIREVAPLIQQLPIVDDHRQLKQYVEADRHLAAYGAIGCVLDHAIPDVIQQTILVLTMRYDYNLLTVQPEDGWDGVRRASSISSRHDLVQGILQYSRSRYFELVRLAYDELANQLLLRDVSPCRAAAEQQIMSQIERTAVDRLLGLFSVAGHEALRERLAVLALEQFDSRWKGSGASATERLISIVRQALAREYPDAVRAYVRHMASPDNRAGFGQNPRPLHGYAAKDVDLDYLITGDSSVSFLDRLDKLPSLIGITPPTTMRRPDGEEPGARTYHVSKIRQSYRLLAAVLSSSAADEGAAVARVARSEFAADTEDDTPPQAQVGEASE